MLVNFYWFKEVMKFFLCVMGMVMIVEGLPYFASPKKMKEIIFMLLSMDDAALRKLGFALMVFGLMVVYLTLGRF